MWDRSSDAVFGMLWTFGEELVELLVLGGELIATVQPDNPSLHVKATASAKRGVVESRIQSCSS